jgi:hypothetical protein
VSRGGRVIVVLGYTDLGLGVLHPICAERLAHAATIATDEDVVVLSGWARVPGTRSEAEMMAEGWTGRSRMLVVDPDARTTSGNAVNSIDDVATAEASEVVIVTSRWHAPRALLTFRWHLRHMGASVRAESSSGGGGLRVWLREIPCWAVLPLQIAVDWARKTTAVRQS